MSFNMMAPAAMKTEGDTNILGKLGHVRLPVMPQVLVRLMELCRNQSAGMAELAAVIATDPGITARILVAAASPIYRRNRAVPNLEQALLLIGTNMVKTLVISEALFQAFSNSLPPGSTNYRNFWKHSLYAAVTAQAIAEKMAYDRKEEAYLAGLLHDVGRIILLSAAPDTYLWQFNLHDDEAVCVVEKQLLGITHAQAGAWVAEQWKLDSFIADSIRFHHESAERLRSTHPLIRIAALAHHLAGDAQMEAKASVAANLCGLTHEDLYAINQTVKKEIAILAAQLDIDLADIDSDATYTPPLLPPPGSAQEKLFLNMQSMMLASQLSRYFDELQQDEPIPIAITKSACLLFNLKNAVLLNIDKPGYVLKVAQNDTEVNRLLEFSIPLDARGNITSAFMEKRIAYLPEGDQSLNVFEEQLQKILEGSLVAIPIVEASTCSTILIGSIESSQLKVLQARENLLQAFSEQVAKVIGKTSHSPLASHTAISDDITTKYRLASRAIVHEVNNPLSIIRNYLTVLQRKASKQESVDAEILILQEEIDRVTNLMNNFAAVPNTAEKKSTDLVSTASRVVRLLTDSQSVPPSVKIAVQSMENAIEVSCGSGTLQQILLNLIKNAVEALPDGGTIDIINNGFTHRDGHLYVSVSIKDNGPGIPADVMARLFSPVQTTKGGLHKGMGLSITHGLVKQIGGQVYCQSGRSGTTFELLFPTPVHL